VSPHHLIQTLGTLGVLGIIFAETGLLIGFFLPGDSLLVVAGSFTLSSQPGHIHLNLFVLLVGCFVAAVAGAEVGYVLGRTAGPRMFNRPKSRFFKPEYVARAQAYFDRYGNRTIVLARFVPVVRTFANPVAGVSKMDGRVFLIWNVLGAALWTTLVLMLGRWIGTSVSDVYLVPGVIVVSTIPLGVEFLRHRRGARAAG
jgi:membrane-associated protein